MQRGSCGISSIAVGCWSRRTRSCAARRRIVAGHSAGKGLCPLVKELAAADSRVRVPVAVSCRVLKPHRQHYYAWLACPVTDAELAEAYLANALFDEVTAAGHKVSDRTVWKICSSNQWWCMFGKKRRGRKARAGAPAHEDLVCREFTADEPNRLWLTDISEHPTSEGKLCICAVKDVWSNRIVGYSIAERMTSQLAVDALELVSV